MTDLPTVSPAKHSLPVRALWMLLMAVAFHITACLLSVIALVQIILTATTGAANSQLTSLGRELGQYLRQIAGFVSFADDTVPFPLSDWPSGQ